MGHLVRALQLVGLAVMGFGLFIGLYEQNIRLELRLAAIGGILFLAGWALQRRRGGT